MSSRRPCSALRRHARSIPANAGASAGGSRLGLLYVRRNLNRRVVGLMRRLAIPRRSRTSCGSLAGRLAPLLQRADKIGFAELDAIMPQDVVCGRSVEVEVRKRELQQIIDAREVLRFAANRSHDFTSFGSVDLFGFERAQVF